MNRRRNRMNSTQGVFLGVIAAWVFLLGLAAGLGKLTDGLVAAGVMGVISMAAMFAAVSRPSSRECGGTPAECRERVDA